MDTLLNLCLGVGLASACGFRIFVPFLVMNLAAKGGYLNLSGGFSWIGTDAALIVFAVATVLEIGAYYIPWVDNLLDTIASPLAVVAGIVVAASSITGMNPMLKWTLAVIAGGGAAGLVQGLTGVTRGASTAVTAGAANFVVASAEAAGSVALSVLAVALPLLAVLVFLAFALVLGRFLLRRLSRAEPTPATG